MVSSKSSFRWFVSKASELPAKIQGCVPFGNLKKTRQTLCVSSTSSFQRFVSKASELPAKIQGCNSATVKKTRQTTCVSSMSPFQWFVSKASELPAKIQGTVFKFFANVVNIILQLLFYSRISTWLCFDELCEKIRQTKQNIKSSTSAVICGATFWKMISKSP